MSKRFMTAWPPALFLAAVAFWPVAAAQDHQRELDRHVKVTPVAQSTGVATGLVIAYGHVIPAPYRFTYVGSKLYVNEVQLIPSPVADMETEKIRARITGDKQRLFDELDRIEARARKMFMERRSHEDILQFMKSQSAIIADAKWEGERSMALRLVGAKDFTQAIWFSGLTQETKKQARELTDPQELQRRLIDQYERGLANGVCLFFSSDNGVMRMDDPRAKINEVMGKASMPADERERAVLEIFPMNRIAAFDVLANYSAEKWARKKE